MKRKVIFLLLCYIEKTSFVNEICFVANVAFLSTVLLAIDLGNKRDSHMEEDRITQLPDAILFSIISLLSIREAASTCVVSKRWRDLWTYIRCLNFDDPKGLAEQRSYGDSIKSYQDKRWSRYKIWVNRVLASHQATTVDQFRIRFDLDCQSRGDLDKWIDFAFGKRVRRLEVDLNLSYGYQESPRRYTFPEKTYRSPYGLSCIKSLMHLSLSSVNISGELLEHFLSNCPLLVHLCVYGSRDLVNLKVAGSSLQLKFLQIRQCIHFESVEISAPNLVLFGYFGIEQQIRVHIKHAPSLVKLDAGYYEPSVIPDLCSMSSYFSQLETLELALNFPQEIIELPEFPELTNLKNLTLKVIASDSQSLLDWTFLIKKAPFLHRFTLKLINHVGQQFMRNWRNIRKAPKCPHQCLKVVEFVGFVGCTIDTELAMYLLENAVMLEKVIIDRRNVLSQFNATEKELQASRQRALQLETLLPPGVELFIVI